MSRVQALCWNPDWVALDWFTRLPNNSIVRFDDLSHAFVTQFVANNERPPSTADLFDVRQ